MLRFSILVHLCGRKTGVWKDFYVPRGKWQTKKKKPSYLQSFEKRPEGTGGRTAGDIYTAEQPFCSSRSSRCRTMTVVWRQMRGNERGEKKTYPGPVNVSERSFAENSHRSSSIWKHEGKKEQIDYYKGRAVGVTPAVQSNSAVLICHHYHFTQRHGTT